MLRLIGHRHMSRMGHFQRIDPRLIFGILEMPGLALPATLALAHIFRLDHLAKIHVIDAGHIPRAIAPVLDGDNTAGPERREITDERCSAYAFAFAFPAFLRYPLQSAAETVRQPIAAVAEG